MLINSPSVAQAPSRQAAPASSHCAATAGPRQLAGFGPGVVARERGQAGPAVEASRTSGIWSGGNHPAAGYLTGLDGSFQPVRLPVNPAQAGPIQASATTKSTVHNSNHQHNSIQMARLIPAGWGEVGPHPEREPGPA